MLTRSFALLATLAVAGSQASPASTQVQTDQHVPSPGLQLYTYPNKNAPSGAEPKEMLDRRIVLLPGMKPMHAPAGTHILRRGEASAEANSLDRRIELVPGSGMHPVNAPDNTYILRRDGQQIPEAALQDPSTIWHPSIAFDYAQQQQQKPTQKRSNTLYLGPYEPYTEDKMPQRRSNTLYLGQIRPDLEKQEQVRRADEMQVSRLDPTRDGTFFGP